MVRKKESSDTVLLCKQRASPASPGAFPLPARARARVRAPLSVSGHPRRVRMGAGRLAHPRASFHNRLLTFRRVRNRMNDPISFFGFSTTLLELVSFVLSIATVLLNIRRNHWAWLFAILSSGAYAIVFFQSRLYGDAGLQGVFILASVWGWTEWLRGAGSGNGAGEGALAVSSLSRKGWIWSLAGWAIGFALLSNFLGVYTDTDVPRIDAFLTAGSLLGTALTAKKKIENWHTWIVVDVLYVGLYVYKGLHLTAVLYAVFVGLAVVGLRAWQRAALVAREPAAAIV
jgi:nicotinamide mononucleotide transporter